MVEGFRTPSSKRAKECQNNRRRTDSWGLGTVIYSKNKKNNKKKNIV